MSSQVTETSLHCGGSLHILVYQKTFYWHSFKSPYIPKPVQHFTANKLRRSVLDNWTRDVATSAISQPTTTQCNVYLLLLLLQLLQLIWITTEKLTEVWWQVRLHHRRVQRCARSPVRRRHPVQTTVLRSTRQPRRLQATYTTAASIYQRCRR